MFWEIIDFLIIRSFLINYRLIPPANLCVISTCRSYIQPIRFLSCISLANQLSATLFITTNQIYRYHITNQSDLFLCFSYLLHLSLPVPPSDLSIFSEFGFLYLMGDNWIPLWIEPLTGVAELNRVQLCWWRTYAIFGS